MKLEKEVKISDYGLSQNDTLIELITLSQFNSDEFTTFDKMLESKKIKLTLEVEEPILDEEERKYLSGVIMPFRDRITDIIKYKSYDFENKEYIVIHCNQSETTMFPYFDKGTMYKGMELNKEYTLEELGL